MDCAPLANALGLEPDDVERAAEELRAEREARRFANEVLRPFRANAHANYLVEDARLKAEVILVKRRTHVH